MGGGLDSLNRSSSIVFVGALDVSNSGVGRVVGLVDFEGLVLFVGRVVRSDCMRFRQRRRRKMNGQNRAHRKSI